MDNAKEIWTSFFADESETEVNVSFENKESKNSYMLIRFMFFLFCLFHVLFDESSEHAFRLRRPGRH